MNRENLTKLADYLDTVDSRYFNMGKYAQLSGNGTVFPHNANYCNAICCAIGHGPRAGIPAHEHERWNNYAFRVFDLKLNEWRFLFSSSWEGTTPKQAAQRIRFFLKHGVPEQFEFHTWHKENPHAYP